MNLDQLFTEKLRRAVEQKIIENWGKEKQIEFGEKYTGIEEIGNKNALYEAVCSDIDELLVDKLGLEKAADRIISKHSVGRLLNVKYTKPFSDKVKDTFSIYAGYESYNDFCFKNHKIANHHIYENQASEAMIPRRKKRTLTISIAASILILTGMSSLFFLYGNNRTSKEPVFEILNGDTMFYDEEAEVKYDLKDLNYIKALIEINGQVVFINDRKGIAKFLLKSPGLRQINLRVDDKVIEKKTIFVKTKEWWASINNTRPINDLSFIENGLLRLPINQIDPNLKEVYGGFQILKDFNISGDEMIFETRIKNSEEMGGNWAFDVSINLNGFDDFMTFNLLAPDATIYTNMKIAKTVFETPSERMALNKLGVDLSYWRYLKVVLQNQKATIYLDDKLIFSSPYTGNLGKFIGCQFYIKGRGAVDWIKISNLEGSVVFEDDFER